MVGTAWGKPAGKFVLGTDSGGIERSLLGKFVNVAPALVLDTMSIRPAERRVGLSPATDVILGAVIGVILTKLIK